MMRLVMRTQLQTNSGDLLWAINLAGNAYQVRGDEHTVRMPWIRNKNNHMVFRSPARTAASRTLGKLFEQRCSDIITRPPCFCFPDRMLGYFGGLVDGWVLVVVMVCVCVFVWRGCVTRRAYPPSPPLSLGILRSELLAN